MPRYTSLVESLPSTVPFVGPETQERAKGKPFKARLGANESGFGPSPRAAAAMAQAGLDVWQYADPENHDIKHALAAHHGVAPQNIVVGEGIDGLLGLLVRMIVEKDTPVITSQGAYPTFNFHVAGFGGKLVQVPYVDDKEDPDSLLTAIREYNAPLAYIANPDNPMGSWHSAEKIRAFIEQLPSDTLLCLDEAYGEFAPEGTLPALDVNETRVIRMRTFSKAYGMAGARIGYAIAHADLCSAFNKVRNHFGVNRLAQAGAVAALKDQEWLDHVIREVEASRSRISQLALAHGLTPLPSATNFITIDCGEGPELAQAFMAELVARGIFVRMPFVAPQNRCIRISTCTDEDMAALEEVFGDALNAARAKFNEKA